MNEEQRAVLAAVARLEESRSGPIDEYTVARASGLLDTDLSGQDWMLRPEREAIRRLFDELEEQGMLRLDRTGYWRPRTTLAGRRALQTPSAAPFPHRGAVPVEDESPLPDESVRGEARTWPAWWPAALRTGDPSSAPLLALIALVAALILVVLVVLGVRAMSGGAPTPTATAPPVAAAPSTATATATAVATATPAAAAASPVTPTTRPTATLIPLAPTATPRDNPPVMVVDNTEGKGAFLFATPSGERRFAVKEGTELLDIGPDETDATGRLWKHVRVPDYNNFEGWIPAEYTAPAQP
jgi:hypothetical protein